MIILGIETSCDDTSVSLVKDGRQILSNIIFSQEEHKKFSGVVPEIASRKHLENIHRLINDVLENSTLNLDDIDAIAVTVKPGLIGSLLVGMSVASTLSYLLKKPLIPVNHIEAHIYSVSFENDIKFPFIGLVVSGGHTLMMLWNSWLDNRIIGTTIDDSVGEAFDKVAKLLNLGYPGGPIIDNLSRKGKDSVKLPLVMLNSKEDRYNFSYSGLKTAVVHYLKNEKEYKIEDLCFSFQKSAIDVIYKKTLLASQDFGIKNVVIGGGVAANSYLRNVFLNDRNLNTFFPSLKLCTDNAAMVAGLAYHMYLAGFFVNDPKEIKPIDKILTYNDKKSFRK